MQGKIELVDDNIILNEDFKKNVAIPYFKDIYKDLSAQSDAKSKGINKVSILNYSQLPGIIGERFFAVLDLKSSGYVDLKEFVHGFFKIYYSDTETKLKFAFDLYDFDRDSYIIPDDVRLILSHIPIENTVAGHVRKEGHFTQSGGGSQVFLDRLRNQEQIENLINEVFGSKRRIGLEEFKRINCEVTSEMFLSIMILLQNSLPCTENFYRYQKNFEKYINSEEGGDTPSQDRPGSGGKVKTIASPRMLVNSPLASLAK